MSQSTLPGLARASLFSSPFFSGVSHVANFFIVLLQSLSDERLKNTKEDKKYFLRNVIRQK